jgi:hypothetical protein
VAFPGGEISYVIEKAPPVDAVVAFTTHRLLRNQYAGPSDAVKLRGESWVDTIFSDGALGLGRVGDLDVDYWTTTWKVTGLARAPEEAVTLIE